jgi:hypothetical protein
MGRIHGALALFLLACAAFAQTVNPSGSSRPRVIWAPPAWEFLHHDRKATVPKEMLATLRVSDLLVRLEDTQLQDVRSKLGGTIGSEGDGGDFYQWLCFYGADRNSTWALWLESAEIDGGRIGSFRWQRLSRNDVLDKRCQMLREMEVELPVAVGLGIAEADVLKTLGQPTLRSGSELMYEHEHQESISGEPYTSNNTIAIRLRAGRVWAIEVIKTTQS